jgi:hypothetical protein
MKKQQIIKAMNNMVVEMTEKRAKKARKLIEGKGMRVEENHFSIRNGQMKFMFYYKEKWIIDYKTDEKLMPWKQFKAMFQKQKKRGIEIITFGIDFGLMGLDLSVEDIIKHEKIDTAKPEKEKEQEIDWSKKGQLVVYEDNETSFVVKTDGTHIGTSFGGKVTKNIKGNYWSVGYVSNGWNKSSFKPYTENLTDFEKLDPIVRELMLFEQVRQGNKRNEEVFKRNLGNDLDGFDWEKSLVGHGIWYDVIENNNTQPLIQAYKAKASEIPELMEIFKKHGYFQGKEIDWSKPLQVVECEIMKVLTSGKHKDGIFSGFGICENSAGMYNSNLNKLDFKLCENQNLDLLK